MLGILEHTLLSQAVRPLARHTVVAFALREFQGWPHTPPVRKVTRNIGISQRRFIQLFTDHVGLTPKLFCRIRRFQNVLRLVRTGEPFQWADVALASGYYDQSHFIHDFTEFSGFTPKAYRHVWDEHLRYGARWTR